MGVALGYSLLALQSLQRGISKLEVASAPMLADLDDVRRYGVPEPYEKLKALTRGRRLDADALHDFIQSLEIPDDAKARLVALTPQTYTGYAADLAAKISD